MLPSFIFEEISACACLHFQAFARIGSTAGDDNQQLVQVPSGRFPHQTIPSLKRLLSTVYGLKLPVSPCSSLHLFLSILQCPSQSHTRNPTSRDLHHPLSTHPSPAPLFHRRLLSFTSEGIKGQGREVNHARQRKIKKKRAREAMGPLARQAS